MKSAISTLIGSTLLATTFVGFSAVDAHAIDCNDSTVTVAGISFSACEEGSGNDTGARSTLIGDLNGGLFSDLTTNWSEAGKSDDGNDAVTAANGSTSGAWSVDGDLLDFGADGTTTFALSLKASNKYSVFLFENISQSLLDADGFLSGTFTTNGVSTNGRGNAQALSHSTLWAFGNGEESYNPPADVPEPSAAAALGLLAAGLFGMKRRASK
ncbi:PEP-CTERM sorting domain-containing protein [Roseofilum sp. Guam]|uniref:PEP-CTERM sorting domain-containing protein n=1 Tax=Roseofilum sp. Guam TaxID=2821502 RepID=UPI001B2EF2F8|nr:PEP-CTERM sorting domain-containing protein [Roseofilum sp. Guam]MBP0029991.1 PEP-CTERM sorting domain-containing protein [Roseofilum sp. Guam]